MAQTNVQAFSGDVAISSNLAVDTNTLFVDSVGNKVGIGVASPVQALTINGGTLSYGGPGGQHQGLRVTNVNVNHGSSAGIGMYVASAVNAVPNASVSGTLMGNIDTLWANGYDAYMRFFVSPVNSTTVGGPKMVIKDNGNVGIGTNAPTSNLHVVGDVAISSNLAVDTNTLFVDSVGNKVGIGVTNPDAKLHVNGNAIIGDIASVSGLTHQDAQLILGGTHNEGYNIDDKIKLLITGGDNDGGSPYYIMCQDENDYDQFFLKGGNTSSGTGGIMYFKGNVGIGADSPDVKLQVEGTSTSHRKLTKLATYNIKHHRSDGGFENLITYSDSDGQAYYDNRDNFMYVQIPAFSGETLYTSTVTGYNGSYFRAQFRDLNGNKPDLGTNTYYKVHVYSSLIDAYGTVTTRGNVGIGTASPLTSLHINSTDALVIPSGTGSQRPSNTVNGMIRLNTALNAIEYYNNNWISLAPVSTPIVTRGLLATLDASDATSYSGTGSTWYSTTAGGRNGNIQGNVSWTGNGQASYFDFPGANADRIVQNGGTTQLYKDICIVFKVDAMNNSFAYLVSNGSDRSLRLVEGNLLNTSGNTGDWSSSTGTIFYENGTATTSNIPITNGQWYIIGGESKCFSSAFNYTLGFGYNSRALNGQIAFVALYDSVLTATEQVQNYNALKARFGL